MAKGSYATKQILNWMEYFSKEMQVSLEKIKLLDICGKQKNVIPAIMICGMRLASRKKDR